MEEKDKKYYKIRSFSDLLGNHVSTVNNWFKTLEDTGVHYVGRVNDLRVYDEIDVSVGKYIVQKRKDGWSLEAIFNSLREDDPPIELRPFPDEFTGTNQLSLTTVNEIQTLFRREMNSMHSLQQEELNVALADQIKQLHESIKMDRKQERQQEITDMITSNRIKMELELEALREWEKKPASERFIKTGFFKKEENISKRDIFVKTYVKTHYENRMHSSFSIEPDNLLE